MAEAKKSTRVGSNMKPRGVKLASVAGAEEVSTDAVREEAPEGLDSSDSQALSTGVTLEVEAAETENQSATENSGGFEAPKDVAHSTLSNVRDRLNNTASLADLLKASREFEVPVKQVEPIEIAEGALVKPATQEEIDAIFTANPLLRANLISSELKGMSLEPGAFLPISSNLGPQADGTHKLVLTVREGYWEGIAQAAEVDRVTPEEWVSERFNAYLEDWFFGRG